MIQIIGIAEILGILENSSSVVQELCPVDHVGDFGNVELVQLSERCENVECFVFVGRDFRVQNFNGLVGFPEVNLTVMAQISVVMQRRNSLSVAGN